MTAGDTVRGTGLPGAGGPRRRTLLDQLRERDGQALNELEAALPKMTRFGGVKHLRADGLPQSRWQRVDSVRSHRGRSASAPGAQLLFPGDR